MEGVGDIAHDEQWFSHSFLLNIQLQQVHVGPSDLNNSPNSFIQFASTFCLNAYLHSPHLLTNQRGLFCGKFTGEPRVLLI